MSKRQFKHWSGKLIEKYFQKSILDDNQCTQKENVKKQIVMSTIALTTWLVNMLH